MELQKMSKEELIAQIDVLSKRNTELAMAAVRYKEMESVLRSSDERFRLFFDAAPIGLSISNAKGDILNANKTIQDFLGYSLEEFATMNLKDIYADSEESWQHLVKVYKSDCVRNFETKLKHKDGTILNILMNSDYINLDGAKVFLSSIYDITSFKQIQKKLKESQESYQLLFKNAPVGITVTNAQGKLSASNQAVQELLGYSAEELKKKNVIDFYCDNLERQRLLALTKESGIVRDFETKFIDKNGKIINVLINTDLIEFQNQDDMLLTSIRDITSLKQIEEDLTKERDFITAVLDTATSLIMVLDRDGVVTRFNKACEKTSGYSFREMKDRPVWEIISVDPQRTKEKVKNLVGGNYPSTHESLWLTKSGAQRLISWSNTVLLDSENNVDYIVATGVDITEFRQMEIDTREANENLLAGIKELEMRNAEMSRLSEMGEQLQSCQNIGEACAISAQYIQKICPSSNGPLYLIRPSRDLAEAVEMWGDTASTAITFPPMNCWALRRGRSHLVDDNHPGLLCGHVIEGAPDGQYLCVPLMARGEAMGIIHLNHSIAHQDTQKTVEKLCDEHKAQLIAAVADHISLALSNLKLQETMRQQSIRDTLTGLYNRRYLEESLNVELQRVQLEQRPLGLIMFDIDHFKEFNDLFGHDGGDVLLREMGHLLVKKTRGGDIVSRYGGDEFVAMFPNANIEDTVARAEELRRGVEELVVYHMGKAMGKCAISIGVAAYPEHGNTCDELLRNADNALYRAKNEGRNKVIVAQV